VRRFIEELKGARSIEWCLVVLAVAILLLTQWTGAPGGTIKQTEQEQRLSAILSRIDGAGTVDVMISEEGKGVLIVAEGADHLGVSLRLQYAAQTLLGTEITRIEIIPCRK